MAAGAQGIPLIVIAAHRRGQVLAPDVEELGGYRDGPVRTAPRYRMVALDTQPPKPGVYRSDEGRALVGERWILSEAALGQFLTALPEPMLLGSMQLDDGTSAVGFACDAVAASSSQDITHHEDWLTALSASFENLIRRNHRIAITARFGTCFLPGFPAVSTLTRSADKA